jgi:hypothetical protein
MAEYKCWKTGEMTDVDSKNFQFPPNGEKILQKIRPPVAKTMKTD